MAARPRPRAKQASVDVAQNSSSNVSLSSTIKSPLSPTQHSRIAVEVDNSDDDDFFTKKRRMPGPALARPAPIGITEELMSGDSEDEEVMQAGSGNEGNSSDGGNSRRKKARRKLASWTKTTSFSKNDSSRLSSRRDSSSQEEDGARLTDYVSGKSTGTKTRKPIDRSPSLTPPPPLDKETLERLESVLEKYHPTTVLNAEEDEGDDSLTQDTQQPLDLDPDLARIVRGERARQLRKLHKEREAQRQREEEMARREERARLATHKEAIEVSDSDDENVPSSSARNRTSSSPIEVVSSSFRSENVKTALPAPERGEEEEKEQEQEQEEEQEEVERINVVMKGGQGGALVANVRVKPTTQMQRLLDHFIELYRKEIPKTKLKSIRVRFDGEWINPKTTVGELELEDDDQVDIIW